MPHHWPRPGQAKAKRAKIVKDRGKLVIVRALDDQALVRRIWAYDERAVYVTDESGYIRLLSGDDVMPIGFRREDIFRYDPRMAERSAADDTTATTGHTPPWGEMELWREEQE